MRRRIIRNIYHTLMTRWMYGCVIYCVDETLKWYIKSRLKRFDKSGNQFRGHILDIRFISDCIDCEIGYPLYQLCTKLDPGHMFTSSSSDNVYIHICTRVCTRTRMLAPADCSHI